MRSKKKKRLNILFLEILKKLSLTILKYFNKKNNVFLIIDVKAIFFDRCFD